jgi:hypothetical protein
MSFLPGRDTDRSVVRVGSLACRNGRRHSENGPQTLGRQNPPFSEPCVHSTGWLGIARLLSVTQCHLYINPDRSRV